MNQFRKVQDVKYLFYIEKNEKRICIFFSAEIPNKFSQNIFIIKGYQSCRQNSIYFFSFFSHSLGFLHINRHRNHFNWRILRPWHILLISFLINFFFVCNLYRNCCQKNLISLTGTRTRVSRVKT